ncbi:membrane dipeptidase [Chromobacterium haemolyticum]|nr:membrane dipeptidase [Chromobacterium haemolyticum]
MDLHTDALVIDGLIIAKWGRPVFEDMRRGGLSAANCTVSVWEGFQDTVNNIAEMKGLIREHGDLLTLVRGVEDIRRAKAEGRTGVILGFQNAHASKTGWSLSKPSPIWACAWCNCATTRKT